MIGRKGKRSEEEGKERKKKFWTKEVWEAISKNTFCLALSLVWLSSGISIQHKEGSKNSRQCQYCCLQGLLNMDRQTDLIEGKDLGVSEHDRRAST